MILPLFVAHLALREFEDPLWSQWQDGANKRERNLWNTVETPDIVSREYSYVSVRREDSDVVVVCFAQIQEK